MYCFLKYTKVPVLSISTLVFSFYHLFKPKSAACVHSFPPTRTVHTYGGGEEENCQQPILYTYVTWHLFAYLCLALSLSCWPKNSPGQLSNPPVTPPKILWGGGMLPSRLHVFWATWPHPFSTCLELSSHLNN